MPKKTKYRKSFRGRRKGNSKGGNVVAFGDFGIKQLKPHMSLPDKQKLQELLLHEP